MSTPPLQKNSRGGDDPSRTVSFDSPSGGGGGGGGSSSSSSHTQKRNRVSALLELSLSQAPLPLSYATKFTECLDTRGDTLKMSRFTLKFSDAFLESEFVLFHHDATIWRSRAVLVAASVVYLAWGLSDLIADTGRLAAILPLRFSLVFAALATAGYGYFIAGKSIRQDSRSSSQPPSSASSSKPGSSSAAPVAISVADIDSDSDSDAGHGNGNGNGSKGSGKGKEGGRSGDVSVNVGGGAEGSEYNDATTGKETVFSVLVALTVFLALTFTVVISYLQEESFPKMETTGFVIVLASAVVVLKVRFWHGFLTTNLFILGWIGVALGVGFGYDIPAAKDAAAAALSSAPEDADSLETDLVLRILVVALAHVIFIIALYENEAIMRRQFLRDTMLRCEFAFTKAENANLRDLLDTIREEKDPGDKVDLTAPAEKMVITLEAVKESKRVSRSDAVQLDWMIALLRSNAEIYAPDISEATNNGGLDRETSLWLVNSVTGGGGGSMRRKSLLDPVPKLATIPSGKFEDMASIEVPEDPEIRKAMLSWNFDVRILETARPDSGMQFTVRHALRDLGVYSKDSQFRFHAKRLGAFLDAVAAGYHAEVAYHNASHAADVVQATYFLLQRGGLRSCFEDIEVFSMVIGAAIHDLDHPGLNNNFEIATRSDRALMYNDQSPLENHHVARAFFLMREEPLNILDGVPKQEYDRVRQCLVDIVLSTDLKNHFAIVAQLKALISSGFDREKREDRLMMAKAIVKCADVSNPTRPTEVMDLWTDRFIEETFAQGDKEKGLKLPVSAFMDRHNTSVPKLETGFIAFLVKPLYEQLDAFASSKGPINDVFKQLLANETLWKKRLAKEDEEKAKKG